LHQTQTTKNSMLESISIRRKALKPYDADDL
jgi:hypothetical protein